MQLNSLPPQPVKTIGKSRPAEIIVSRVHVEVGKYVRKFTDENPLPTIFCQSHVKSIVVNYCDPHPDRVIKRMFYAPLS